MQKQLTAIIEKKGTGYVSFCPEYDIASQGETAEEAHKNLQEALENIKDAARGYLESLKKHNEPIPPSIYEETVEIHA